MQKRSLPPNGDLYTGKLLTDIFTNWNFKTFNANPDSTRAPHQMN